MALKIGDKAPDFTLISFTPTADPVEISLSSYLGKNNVVLLFFPQAFTGVCTEQICTVSDNFDKFSGLDTVVLGISVDGTFVQKAFAKEKNITFPLLSDFNKTVIKSYDNVHEVFAHGMKNVSKRAVFLVGKDGLIKYMEVTENPGVQINFDKLKEEIVKL